MGIFSIRYSGIRMSSLKSMNIANTDNVQELVLLTSKCMKDIERVFEGTPHNSQPTGSLGCFHPHC